MSETVSFLGGAAIAGLAALLLLRGGSTFTLASPPALQPSPAPSVITPPPAPVPAVAASPPALASGQQDEARKTETENLRLQLDQQKLEIEKLKYQIQRQEGFIQTMAQAKVASSPVAAAPAASNAQASQSPANSANQVSPLFTNLLWATGGVTVCLVGGTLLLGAITAISRQQSRGRGPVAYPVSRVRLVPYRRRYPTPDEPYILPPDEPYVSAYPPEPQPVPRRAEYRYYE